MEIVGGFMVMMSIISLFLAVVWLVMPFVVFAIKGKQDRILEVLEVMEKRLAAIEAGILPTEPPTCGKKVSPAASTGFPVENGTVLAASDIKTEESCA